jgi:hypothetical protein
MVGAAINYREISLNRKGLNLDSLIILPIANTIEPWWERAKGKRFGNYTGHESISKYIIGLLCASISL